MKHDKKQYQRILMGMLFVAASAAMVHGCTLEDLLEDFAVDSEGNYIGCRNLQQIMILRNDESTIVYYRDENEGAFADVFAANVCPVAAPNCIYEWISDISDIEDSEEPNKQKGICNNCPSNYMLCKDKCVDSMNPNLHIENCILDYLTCEDDYYDFNDDSSDGCEFQLSPVHIDKTRPQTEGSWNCLDGYADIDKNPYNGCEINGWTDKAHCGAGIIDGDTRKTGVRCENYEVCTRGSCTESCGENYMLVCDGQCVNTNIDNAYCGGCDSPCSLTVNDARAAVACQDGGCHAIACQPGYYLEDADEAVAGKIVKMCKSCADGKYTTSATATGCIDCPTTTGAASMVFDAENNICKAETCLAGYALKDGSCEPCEECEALDCGKNQHIHGNSCEDDSTEHCGAHGHKCTTLAHGISACTNGQCVYTCNAGYYWKAEGCTDNKCCQPCPAGSYCPTAGLTSPIPCPVGHYCPDTTSDHPTPCPEGTYQENMESTQCEPCGNNQISAAGSAECAQCSKRTHANSDHTACVGCNTKDDCVKTTGANEMRCSSEKFCKAKSCLAGYKLINNEKCEPCPAGSISTSDNSCTPCPEGTYVSDNTCISCPAGSYCPTAGLTTPIPCTIGHYCPAKNSTECGTGTACAKNHPTACPMGTYRGNISGESESDCINCPKGMHNDGYGAWACSLIPAGYIGLNCRNDSKKEGCTQYSMCFDGNSVTKCSNMYGSKSTCSGGSCMSTTNTSSRSCIEEQNGCPAVACCGGACATNNDNCGSCGTKCTGGKTCENGTCK